MHKNFHSQKKTDCLMARAMLMCSMKLQRYQVALCLRKTQSCFSSTYSHTILLIPDVQIFFSPWPSFQDLLLWFDNLLEQPIEPRKTVYYCRFTTKDILEDANEQPYEEINRMRSERIPSVPIDLGYTTLLAHICSHQPRSSPNPTLQVFFVGIINY